MKRFLIFVWMGIPAFIATAPRAPAQTPLGTDFNYQGQLMDGGSPASGSYDVQFMLFDADTVGNQIGSTICADNVDVASGLFTLVLDFGAVFNGHQRWLEIGVRADTGLNCANQTGFTILSPRLELLAVPNALFSTAPWATNGANISNTNTGNVGIGTASPSSDLSVAGDVDISGSRLHVGTNGKVGIGTMTPGTKLDVNATGTNIPFRATSVDGEAGFFTRGPFVTLPGLYPTALHVSNEGAETRNGIIGVIDHSDPGGGCGVGGMALNMGIGVCGNSYGTSGIGVSGWTFASSGTTNGGYFRSDSTSGTGAIGWATAASGNTYGVYGQSDSTGGIGVGGRATADSGTTNGGYFRSDSTSGAGVFGWATAAAGTTNGGRFESNSTSGVGVIGRATAAAGTTYGGSFQSDSTSGVGVRGYASAGSGGTVGVVGQSDSVFGAGVAGMATATTGGSVGGYFESASPGGAGVFGWATASSDYGSGVYGQSASTSGTGVTGKATNASGATIGVEGESNSASGTGIVGRANSNSGVTVGVYGESPSASARGVFGWAYSASGVTYGVHGKVNSPSGYGVYSDGPLAATGTQSFRIDHPDDPANKYLLHYAAESPEVINFYSGKATLDGAGQAVVELPRYFAKINRDPRYTLTAVGAPMPTLHVAEEIDEAALSAGEKAEPGEAAPVCSFRIGGGAPGAKVSWRVEAVRNDRWVQHRGAPVEVEKEGLEKGAYQHPDLYGQPPEKGMNYHAEHKRPSPAVVPDAWRQRPKFERPTPPNRSDPPSGSAAAAAMPR